MSDNIEELQHAAEQAEVALGQALVDGTQAEIGKARKVVEAARQAVEDAARKADAIQRRDREAERERKAEAIRQQWAQVRKLADERDALVAAIEKLIGETAKPFARLVEVNSEILGALPARIDTDRAELRPPHAIVIEEFWRANLVGGSPFSLWELGKRPTVSVRIKEAGDYLRGLSK